MPLTDYLGGAVLFSIMFGSAGIGAWLILKRFAPNLRGTEAVVGFGVLLIGALLLIHLVPAIIGLLGRGSVVLVSLLWLVACLAVPRREQEAEIALPESSFESPSFAWTKAVSVLAFCLIAVFYLAFLRDQALVASASIDFGTFHLPNVIRWIQTGSIWQLDNFLPGVSLGTYPNNGDVVLLAFVLPWHNDFFVHAAMWMVYALTGVSVYALARRMGAIKALAVIAGCLVLAIPSVGIAALPNAMTDSVALFGFTAGILFLIRHASSNGTTDLVFAGLALGICFGAKWYSVSTVVIVVLVWLAARAIARHGAGRIARDGAVVTGLIGVSGGVWFVRNWVETGNPLFPVKVEVLGVTIFAAPTDEIREAVGFTIFDYLGDWDAWWRVDVPGAAGQADGILLQWADALAGPAALISIGVLLASVVVVRAPRAHAITASVLTVAVLITCAYVVTPYTAGGPPGIPLLVGADSRYVVPALIAGAVVVAAIASGRRAIEAFVVVLAVPAIMHGTLRAGSGELSPAGLSGSDWAVGTFALVALAGLGFALKRAWPLGKLALACGVALVAVATVVVGQLVQQRFNDARYIGPDSVINALAAESGDPAARIGLAGLWTEEGLSPILPSFGPRFDREVDYIAFDNENLLERFDDRGSFLEAVDRGEFDAVVVGLRRPETLEAIDEESWLESAGWRLVEESERFKLFAPA